MSYKAKYQAMKSSNTQGEKPQNKPKGKKSVPKKTVVIAAVTAAACIAGCALWYFLGHRNSDPVYVYPFQYIGMTEYWGDTQESSGRVSTDKVQTVFLTDTQIIKEVLVKEGDTVKKGDVLMTFDTTLDDLALERKRLEVEKLKLDLDEANKQLREINGMKPMELPNFDFSGGEDKPGVQVNVPKTFGSAEFDGSAPEKSMICWMDYGTTVNKAFLDSLLGDAATFQSAIPDIPEDPEEPSTETEETTEDTEETTKETDETTTDTEEATKETDETTKDTEETTKETDETTKATEETTKETDETTKAAEETTKDTETTVPSSSSDTPLEDSPVVNDYPQSSGSKADDEAPVTPKVNEFWVVIKVTEDNQLDGMLRTWVGLHVDAKGGYTFQFFDASGVPDHSMQPEEDKPADLPDFDFGSGMTAAQIAQMRTEQVKKIKDLDFQIKMAEADYKIMQTEISDGNIYAAIDGSVVTVMEEEDARKNDKPFIKVSGGGGFYVEGSISELVRDSLEVGQEVNITDYDSGQTFTGTVQSVGDFPSGQDFWNGVNNPNASNYPFRVFVDESADLRDGAYVSMNFSAGSSQNGVYVENAFIRKENGRSYVMLKGENGRLEQRFVSTGKSLWGSYTEVLGGVTDADLLAFPYGKNVKAGAAVADGDMTDLYG